MYIQFAQPKVGSQVRVTMSTKDDYLYATSPFQITTIDGIVMPNHKQAQPDAFTLRVKCANVPIREIRMKYVTSLQYADGSVANSTIVNSSIRTLEVTGSKGDKYVVIKDGDKITCSCPGFQYRKNCRHLGMIK